MDSPRSAAVIYAKDPQRIAAFYEHVATMRVLRTAADHIVLESDWFQLVVLRIPERIAKDIAIATPPARRSGTPIKLVFFVSSLVTARRAAADFGGELFGVEREWTFDGTTVCDGCDPEGNVYQLRQVESPNREADRAQEKG